MEKEPFYKKYSRVFQYDNMSNFNPLKVPTIWANTNALLDDFYANPNVNITNDKRGINIKNSMRHIVGPALITQVYGGDFTQKLGGYKEAFDFIRQQPFGDQMVDLRNNQRGINYILNNPNATKQDIMEYALQESIKNYDQDYNSKSLYDLLLDNNQ